MDLDPDKVTNNMNEAAIQAELMKGFQQPAPEAAAPQEGSPPPPAGVNPADPTGAGGGTIGTGIAPSPQEQGFSGNNGQGNNQQAEGISQPPEGMGQLQ